MSLLHLLYGDYEQHDPMVLQRYLRHHPPHPDHFGLGCNPDGHVISFPGLVMAAIAGNRIHNILQPKPTIGSDGFQVCINVQHFKPNEISVKTIDNKIIIRANHEEREDEHGFISRNFERKYTLPENYHMEEVVSTLSTDGVLTIKAPPPTKSVNERIIHIQQTGPVHLTVNSTGEKMQT